MVMAFERFTGLAWSVRVQRFKGLWALEAVGVLSQRPLSPHISDSIQYTATFVTLLTRGPTTSHPRQELVIIIPLFSH